MEMDLETCVPQFLVTLLKFSCVELAITCSGTQFKSTNFSATTCMLCWICKRTNAVENNLIISGCVLKWSMCTEKWNLMSLRGKIQSIKMIQTTQKLKHHDTTKLLCLNPFQFQTLFRNTIQDYSCPKWNQILLLSFKTKISFHAYEIFNIKSPHQEN